MKCAGILCLVALLFFFGGLAFLEKTSGAERKGEYLLPGDIKEGWRVFNQKRCGQCHAIWGEGGKGGPDLGALPQAYVSQAQLAALMWNHSPEMWGRMIARKIPIEKISTKEMADLFAFLYFIRYMDEPGSPEKGKQLMETKGCIKCHTFKEGLKEDLVRWSMYVNPIVWAQMMWNHTPQMEQEMKKKASRGWDSRGTRWLTSSLSSVVSPPMSKRFTSNPAIQKQEKHYFPKRAASCVMLPKENRI